MSDKDLAPILIEDLLHTLVERGGSDLHVLPNQTPVIRVRFERQPLSSEDLIAAEPLTEALKSLAPPARWADFNETGDTLFSFRRGELGSFRASYFASAGGLRAVFRALPARSPSAEELKVSEALLDHIWAANGGLVLVGSPPGHGRTTLLAALVDVFNRFRSQRILSLEDPVEIVHDNLSCLVSQRSVRDYGRGFAAAFDALRFERADIIVISELQEPAMVQRALELVSGGSLVLAALPVRSATEALHHVLERAGAERRAETLGLLARRLLAVVTQVLLPRPGGRALAAVRERLICDEMTRALIVKDELAKLPLLLQGSGRPGVTELNQALIRAVQANEVAVADAYRACAQPLRLATELRRAGIELSGLSALELSVLDQGQGQRSAKPPRDLGPGSALSSGALKRRGWIS